MLITSGVLSLGRAAGVGRIADVSGPIRATWFTYAGSEANTAFGLAVVALKIFVSH